MSLRLMFSGEIKKPTVRQVGQKSVLEFGICQKNFAKEGEEQTFTWVNVSIWEPKQFIVDQAVAGAFVSGIGKMELTSYMKDGAKVPKLVVKAAGFDVDFARSGAPAARDEASAPPAPSRPSAPSGGADDSQPPFAICHFQGA